MQPSCLLINRVGVITAFAYIRLIRPLNLVITLAGVALGGVLAADISILIPNPDSTLLLAAAAAVLIAAGGNAVNDLFDEEIDRVNRPDRPLPSGRVSRMGVRAVCLSTTSVGVVLSALVSTPHLLIAVASALILYLYSRRLKSTAFAGNAVVALLVALVIIFGGWAVGPPGATLVGAGFAFLTTFARECIKDIEDLHGDLIGGAYTAAGIFGIEAVRRGAAAALIATVLLTPLPFLLLQYSPLYLLIVLLADVLLLRAVWLLPRQPSEAGLASAWLKGAMAAGMAALFMADATY